MRETATIADTKTREKERNGEEYMACCGRTPPNSQLKDSPRASLHEAVAAAWTLLRFLFLLFIIDLYWTSERNCLFDPVLEKKKRKDYLFICFCSVEHWSFL